ncbi:MAG: DEAD/DEAH box helicase [Succinivibrio sp.]|nr:DEAD/DEAH box helicase [Succinivibrio sp.]
MPQEYGTTWWGKRWLNALSGIDLKNRIPRGKTYANTGKVLDLKLEKERGLILAKVKGHSRSAYKVAMQLPRFTEQEKQVLLEVIHSSPLLLSKLAARELDPSLEEEALRHQITLFPQRFDDLGMACTCPDYAVPCKHLAAVIYKFSQMLDANPFLLFELRGLDLIAEFSGDELNLEQVRSSELATWQQLLTRQDAQNDNTHKSLEECMFTELEDLSEPIVGLLTPNPAGYTGKDLRDELRKCVAYASRLAKRQLSSAEDRDLPLGADNKPALSFDRDGTVHFDKSLSFKVYQHSTELTCRLYDPSAGLFEGAAYYELFSGAIEGKKLELAPVWQEKLFAVWLIASKLMQHGAVIPQMYVSRSGFFAIRWIPAVISPLVRELTCAVGSALQDLVPEHIAIKDGPATISDLSLGEMLLGVFIGSYINRAFSDKHNLEETDVQQQALFLSQNIKLKNLVGAESIRQSLEAWIAPLYLDRLQLLPVLSLSDPLKEQVADEELFANTQGVLLSLGFEQLDEKGRAQEPVIALHKLLSERRYQKLRFEALRTVARLSSICPLLAEQLKSGGDSQEVALADLGTLLTSSLPAMRLLGVRLIMPKSLTRLILPRQAIRLGLSRPWQDAQGYLALQDLLRFNWSLALGDECIAEEDFVRLCRHAGEVVRFKHSFVYVDKALTAKLIKKLEQSTAAPSPQRLMAAALSGSYGEDEVILSRELKEALLRLTAEREVALPDTLKAQLRPYQQRGYQWLYRNLHTAMGSILADDMGLGKTLQVIAALDKLRLEGEFCDRQALVVVPTTLIVNWERELLRFAPELKVYIYYGTSREIKQAALSEVVLTSYGLLRSELKEFKRLKLRLLVLDEAQAIKNAGSQISKAVRQLKADSQVAMSGTPVENRLSEYWSIMDFVNPGLLGSAESFKKNFAYPIERERSPQAVKCFKRITAPFILRRLKTDRSIIADLPDKLTSDRYCRLTEAQAALYQAQVEHTLKQLAEDEDSRRQAQILKLILALKMICDAPELFAPAEAHQGAEHSGKMEALFELLSEYVESQRKLIIFTQFRSMGELLQRWICERTGFRPQFLHGGVPVKERAVMVDNFQNRRDELFMVLSLKAAGVGLNLTAASAVCHYDLWWNPAVEEQATDRAYRIGQKNNVQVYRFICANTFEEKINGMLKAKKELSELTVNIGENWIGDLSNRQLREIFSLQDS